MAVEVRPVALARSNVVDAAVVLSAAAGLAHAFSVPVHLRWWLASGVFFVAMAVAQLGLAGLLVRNRFGERTLLAGIASNVVVVCVYVTSRLVALPGQPVTTGAHHSLLHARDRAFLPPAPEGVGPFDMFALLVELALVLVLAGLVPAPRRGRVTTGLLWVGLAMCGFATWALMLHHANR